MACRLLPIWIDCKTDIHIKKKAGTAHFRNRFIAVSSQRNILNIR